MMLVGPINKPILHKHPLEHNLKTRVRTHPLQKKKKKKLIKKKK